MFQHYALSSGALTCALLTGQTLLVYLHATNTAHVHSCSSVYMCARNTIHVAPLYVFESLCAYIYIYIYIYRERERARVTEREREGGRERERYRQMHACIRLLCKYIVTAVHHYSTRLRRACNTYGKRRRRKTDSIHLHHRPEGVVYRTFCFDSSTSAVSETASRRWWCVEISLPIINQAAKQLPLARNVISYNILYYTII